MMYIGKLMILFLASSSTYFIPLTILHLSLAWLPRDAKMLTACQPVYRKNEGNSVLEREQEGNVGALSFFNTKINLQWLAQILRQSFKLTIISAVA